MGEFKRLLERVLLLYADSGLRRQSQRLTGLVLAYHNVVPDDLFPAGDRSLHLAVSAFRDQLAVLEESAEIVTLASLLDSRAGGSSSAQVPRVAITFDDAYKGIFSVAIPELARAGLPATIFVSPACLGARSFWWDRFGLQMNRGNGREFRNRALDLLGGIDESVTRRAEAVGWVAAGIPGMLRTATEDDLYDAASVKGITFGSHAWSHPNLVKLDDSELRTELVDSLRWLQSRFEVARPWISYPYGRVDRRVESVAKEVGYEAGFRIDGGWLRDGEGDAFQLSRLNIPAGISEAGFRLRLSGLLSGSR